jgi:hypothetical protein
MKKINNKVLLRWGLVLVEGLVGITAVRGGYSLIATNGLGMPIEFLQSSPFESFLIPGLILLFIVGGSNLIAALLIWRRSKYALEASAVAGFGLLIWIVVEQYIIAHPHVLQLIYFALGTLILIFTMLLLRLEKGKSWQ